MTHEKLLLKMRQEAKAYNNTLTDDFLQDKPFSLLIALVHPSSRREYTEQYKKLQEVD
jgi:hypothetical protein